jgi:hypothetical protein
MLTVLLLWLLVFFIFYTIGFSVKRLINAIYGEENEDTSPDVVFFIGFLTLSALTGILSIFIPVGSMVLNCCIILTLALFWLSKKEIIMSLKRHSNVISGLSRWDLAFVIFLLIFILTAVAQKITLVDSALYHVQSIQWARKYAVIPGLGNIHSRLAYNSLFLVISGLFTFQIKDIMIFPLNGICYLVLSLKLFSLYKHENKPGTRWKAVFYILLLLISLLIVIPDLNSPAADIICDTLIIYAFILIMRMEKKDNQLTISQVILLNAVIFSCVSFKISSLFLVTSLLFLYNKKFLQRVSLTAIIGLLILSSFIIRNYYLSGYLIYPFPSLDLFNVDWKIPLGRVLSEKLEIESWAKISTLPTSEVIHLRISEWIWPWFQPMNFMKKLVITGNLLSVFSIVFMILRKDYFFLKIQLIILLNLLFWFLSAPDPRFSMGFLFVGFSLNIAYIIGLVESEKVYRYVRIGLAGFLIMIFCRRIMFPVETLTKPARWVSPPAFGTSLTNEYFTDFHYRVPVEGDKCYNVEIPCVPYQLDDVMLRGKDISDGFKIKKKI